MLTPALRAGHDVAIVSQRRRSTRRILRAFLVLKFSLPPSLSGHIGFLAIEKAARGRSAEWRPDAEMKSMGCGAHCGPPLSGPFLRLFLSPNSDTMEEREEGVKAASAAEEKMLTLLA